MHHKTRAAINGRGNISAIAGAQVFPGLRHRRGHLDSMVKASGEVVLIGIAVNRGGNGISLVKRICTAIPVPCAEKVVVRPQKVTNPVNSLKEVAAGLVLASTDRMFEPRARRWIFLIGQDIVDHEGDLGFGIAGKPTKGHVWVTVINTIHTRIGIIRMPYMAWAIIGMRPNVFPCRHVLVIPDNQNIGQHGPIMEGVRHKIINGGLSGADFGRIAGDIGPQPLTMPPVGQGLDFFHEIVIGNDEIVAFFVRATPPRRFRTALRR